MVYKSKSKSKSITMQLENMDKLIQKLKNKRVKSLAKKPKQNNVFKAYKEPIIDKRKIFI